MNSNRFAILRRRGWVVVVTAVVVTGAAYFYSQRTPMAYLASAYVVVSSGAGSSGPGSANEASTLATTYAGLIPKDSAIIGSVSGQLHQRPVTVRKAISVFTSNSTAILRINYSGSSPRLAIAGAKAVALAIAGPKPATNTIPAGAVLLASLPTSAAPASSTRSLAVPIGLLAGLMLGMVLLIAWERFDPRIDDAKDLAELLPVPVTTEAELTVERVRALRLRWARLVAAMPGTTSSSVFSNGHDHPGGAPALATIGLVVPTDRLSSVEEGLVRQLSAPVSGRGGPSVEHPMVRIVPFGARSTPDGGRLASVGIDLVVLVVRQTERARDVMEAAKSLEDFGLSPRWAILTEPRTHRQRRREHRRLTAAAAAASRAVANERRSTLPIKARPKMLSTAVPVRPSADPESAQAAVSESAVSESAVSESAVSESAVSESAVSESAVSESAV
ncbi:MAG: YveK family protein, partial [Acidimicrobiales bacterium]